MATKLTLSSKEILDKVFPGVSRGYDPLLVDQFLDQILKDYMVIESNELMDRSEIDDLKREIAKLKDENYKLTVENAKFKNRLEGIKDGVVATRDNMDLIRTIDKYERFLYNHGYNLEDIK